MQQTTVDLYEATIKSLQRSPETLLGFLESSSHLYKHSFANQVLIFAQNPGAKLVANEAIWTKLGRRCTGKPLKGIQTEGDISTEIHLYEASETVGDDVAFQRILKQQIWQITDADQEPLREFFATKSESLFPMSLENHILAQALKTATTTAKKYKAEPILTKEITRAIIANRCSFQSSFDADLSYSNLTFYSP